MNAPEALMARAKALKPYGLLAHWEDIAEAAWLAPLLDWEEQERARRGLERRLGNAHLGRFKPLADCDWHWPTQCDRSAIEELMGLRFILDAANVVLLGHHDRPQYRPPGGARRPHRAVHQRRAHTQRAGRRRRPASPPQCLRPPAPVGRRRGRLSVLLQPPCRSAV